MDCHAARINGDNDVIQLPRKIMSKCRDVAVTDDTNGTPTMINAWLIAYIYPKGASQPNALTANLGNVASMCRKICFRFNVNIAIARNW